MYTPSQSVFSENLGHDVITASEIDKSQASDTELLHTAREQGRIFITRDRDFGSLVFVERLGPGVIYLRMQPSNLIGVHQEIEVLLQSHTEQEIMKAFVVVEPGRYRFRRLS